MSVLFSRRWLRTAPWMLLIQLSGSPSLAAPDSTPGADTTATKSGDPLDAEIARLRQENDDAHAAGDYERATMASLLVLDLVRQRGGEHSVDYARARVDHAGNLRASGHASEALFSDQSALAILTERLGEKHRASIVVLGYLAEDLHALGRAADAEPVDRRALALRLEVLGEKDPAILASLSNLAADLRALGRFPEAEPLDRRALALATEILGEQHSDTLNILSHLALDLHLLGRAAEAEPLDRRALVLMSETLGEKHPDTLASLSNLAFDLNSLGRAAEAEPLDRRALALKSEVLGEKHPETLTSLSNLAADLHVLGRVAEAEPLDRRALALRTEILGEKHPDTLTSLGNLANDLRALGRAAEAEPLDRRGLALSVEVLGEKHRDTLTSLNNLASDLRTLGRAAEAEPLDRRALALLTEVLGEKHPSTLTSLSNLAVDLNDLGRSAEAEPLDRRTLALRMETVGEKHPDTLTSRDSLAADLLALGRAAEAEPLLRRTLELRTEVQGERHPDTLNSLNNLAAYLHDVGRMAEAEPLYRRAITVGAEALGEKHPFTLTAQSNLAFALHALGRIAEAELLDRRVLALRTETLGEKHPDTIGSLNNLANDLGALGRAAEAEALDRRALALNTEILGEAHPSTITSLNNLANDMLALGRAAEAEALNRRALALSTKALGEKHPTTLTSLGNLAVDLNALGRVEEAEPLDRRVLALKTELHGEKHPDTLTSLNNLAADLIALGRFAEAEPLLRRALALDSELLGEKHPLALKSLGNLAADLSDQRRYAEAEPLHRRALALELEILGERHRDTLNGYGNLALTLLAQPNRAALAIDSAQRAVIGIRATRRLAGDSAREEAQLSRDTLSQARYFTLLADAAWSAADQRTPLPSLRAEAFGALQDAMAGTASRAVALAAARRLAENMGGELGALAAERQSLSDQWIANEKALTKSLGEGGPDATARRANFETHGQAIEARMAGIDARLAKDAPAYFAMTRPEALAVPQAQALLKPDEALLMVVPTEFGTHLMAVTSEGVQWARAPLAAATIREMVVKLRADLDPGSAAADAGWHYDRKTAHALYQALIVPVLPALKGRKQLFIAADGALASLPFGVLVTREPEGKDDDLAALKSTGWFEDDFALIQLPSLQSLYFLRTFGTRRPASRGIVPTFAGFGDPVLAGVAMLRGKGTGRRITPASIAGSGATRDGGGLADIRKIRELPSLPGTRVELESLGRAIGAPASALHLGADATEARVRSMSLADDRIIAFATHGVMAGEITGAAEPGLILTPPRQPSSDDDGYLSASEITGLKLDADWVILSACNTAAGDGNGTPGLSGLARAFFYAGARSLLASHWPVYDAVAPRITADTIQRQQANPALRRAEALQQSIEAIRDDPSDPTNAHPSVWAPFVLVGDSQ